MLYDTDSSLKLYRHLSELEEKLLKSEAERKMLEAKFQFMTEASRNEQERKLNFLKEKYSEFLEGCKERSIRNDEIMKSLQKVENGANVVFAKTERLKQLRSHYDAYLSRALPLWRHPDVLRFESGSSSWIREPRVTEAPAPRPALLLPGGGAVMLPVHERSAATGLVYPERSQLWVPKCEDKSNVTSLGEAGVRMMRELGLNEAPPPRVQPPQLAPPVYYHPYHLPVYIPPSIDPIQLYSTHERLNATTAVGFGSTVVPPPAENYYSPVRNAPDRDFSKRVQDPVYDRKLYSNDRLIERNSPYNDVTKKYRGDIVRPENPEDVPADSGNHLSYSTDKSDFAAEKDQQGRESYEIECLTADEINAEEDVHLSDDEVLDVAIGRVHSSYRNHADNFHSSPQRPTWDHGRTSASVDQDPNMGKKPTQAPVHSLPLTSQQRTTIRNKNDDYNTDQVALRDESRRAREIPKEVRTTSDVEQVASPMRNTSPLNRPRAEYLASSPSEVNNASPSQKIADVHQQSIDDLKAMLSFDEPEESFVVPETDQPVAYTENKEQNDGYFVDEDVPDEFTEQNYPESQYDPRYQRDVSRNVILEEDEEEEEKPVEMEKNRRDDWRRLQLYRQQGKLTSLVGSQEASQRTPEKKSDRFEEKPRYEEQQKKSQQLVANQPQAVHNNGNPNYRESSRKEIVENTPQVSHQQEEQPSIPHGDAYDPGYQQPPEQQYYAEQNQSEAYQTYEQQQEGGNNVHVKNEPQAYDYYQPQEGDNYYQREAVQPPEAYYAENDGYDPQSNLQNYQDTQQPPQPDDSNYYQGDQQPPYGYYGENGQDESNYNYYNPNQAPNEQNEPNDGYYHDQNSAGVDLQPNQEYYQQPEYKPQPTNMSESEQFYEKPEAAGDVSSYDARKSPSTERPYETSPQNKELKQEERAMSQAQYQDNREKEVLEGAQPYQFEQQQTTSGNNEPPKSSVLNQLMDSESESYKMDPAGSAHDDSDFDFSIGKQ